MSARRTGIGFVVLLALGVGEAEAESAPAHKKKRYISSQAYYHAMRAELAKAQGQPEKVADELQLALVYDAESLHLTILLARAQLRLGRLVKARRHADRAVSLARSSPDAWRVSAEVALAQGKERRAVRELEIAVRRDPDALDAWLDLARIHRAARRPRRALAVLDKAARQCPQSAEPLSWSAEILVELDRLKSASRLLARALVREPRRVDLVARLTTLDQRLLHDERAADRWRTFVEDYPGELGALPHAAQSELVLGRVSAASRYLSRLEQVVEDPSLDERIGFLYFREGEYRRALPYLEKAGGLGAPDPRLRYALGVTHYQLNEDDAALAQFEQIGPGDLYGRARGRIAHLLMNSGQHERAELAVRAALNKRPDDDALIALLGLVLERRGQVDEALELIREARSRNPTSWRLVEREAWLVFRHVGMQDAIAVLRTAEEDEGADRRVLGFLVADLAHEAGRRDLVETALRRLIEDDPTDERALSFLGYDLAKRGRDLPEAQRLVKEALSRSPASSSALDSLGWILFKRNRLGRALRFLDRAHRLEPRNPEVAEHLADTLAKMGESERAHAIYKRSKAGYAELARAREPGREADVDRIQRKLRLQGRR